MKRHRIPKKNPDLRRYAFMRNFKRMAFFLLYIVMWAAAYKVYLTNPVAKPFGILAWVIFSAAVVVSGCAIFRMDKFISERNFTGKIVSMKVSRTYGRGMTRVGGSSVDFFTYRILRIKDSKGRKKRLKFQLFDDGYDLYYREGDTVAYFRGTTYPLCHEAEARGEHICVACGVRAYESKKHGAREVNTEYCESCGRSFIKYEDLQNAK
jgi:hypothetical protein